MVQTSYIERFAVCVPSYIEDRSVKIECSEEGERAVVWTPAVDVNSAVPRADEESGAIGRESDAGYRISRWLGQL